MTTTPAGTEIVRFAYDEPRNTADIAREQQLCFRLRIEHFTIRQIAELTGLGVATVHKRITDEITETVAPYREQYKSMARERLDNMSRKVLDLMSQPRYLVHEGKVVRVDGAPVLDAEYQLRCLDRLMAIERQRAQMEGYNAPVKVDATVTEVTQEDIEAAAMIREAKARAAAQRERLQAEA
jgi:hypothetical protein